MGKLTLLIYILALSALGCVTTQGVPYSERSKQTPQIHNEVHPEPPKSSTDPSNPDNIRIYQRSQGQVPTY